MAFLFERGSKPIMDLTIMEPFTTPPFLLLVPTKLEASIKLVVEQPLYRFIALKPFLSPPYLLFAPTSITGEYDRLRAAPPKPLDMEGMSSKFIGRRVKEGKVMFISGAKSKPLFK